MPTPKAYYDLFSDYEKLRMAAILVCVSDHPAQVADPAPELFTLWGLVGDFTSKDLEEAVAMFNDRVKDREDAEHTKHLEQGRKGAHFCPDWDYMAIHDDMPEAEACLCDLSFLEDQADDR